MQPCSREGGYHSQERFYRKIQCDGRWLILRVLASSREKVPATLLPVIRHQPELSLLLRETSRSFYRTLQLLPGPVRNQIGLAYLLARTSDTIADTTLVEVEQRLKVLGQYRDRLMGLRTELLPLAPFLVPGGGATESERRLLERTELAVEALQRVDEVDRGMIREVLDVIISGQELDLKRFGSAGKERVVALVEGEELNDYTYRVAGCVGLFWTRICSRHLRVDWDERLQLEEGVRFGKGLQLVNILRDLPKDLLQGRCYLPAKELELVGLTPDLLKDPTRMTPLRPVYERYLGIAEEHLQAGWRYTSRIPRGQLRLRLGCALPILIGLRTLQMCRQGNPLDASKRIKVSRGFVRSALGRTLLAEMGLMRWAGLPGWAGGVRQTAGK